MQELSSVHAGEQGRLQYADIQRLYGSWDTRHAQPGVLASQAHVKLITCLCYAAV